MGQVKLRTEVYNRPAKDGSPRFQARFFADGMNTPLRVKSLGKQFANRAQANREAGRLLATMRNELLGLYESKLQGLEDVLDVERQLKERPFGEYVVDFWTWEKSAYLDALVSAGSPPSKMYVANRLSKAVEYILPYQPFSRPVSRVGLLMIEQFFKNLRQAGIDDNLLEPIKKTLQRPITYAIERGLVESPFEMSAVKIPRPKYKRRGILTMEQVVSIFSIATVPLRIVATKTGNQFSVPGRLRLKAGQVQRDLPPVDVREKTFVYATLKSGLRRGELRALRWENVDLQDRPTIHVKENLVPKDGTKLPKAGSVRSVGIGQDLVVLLKLLRNEAFRIGSGQPQDYVFFSAKPGTPISATTIARAFRKVMLHAGIDDETRKDLKIVLHSGRHFFSNLLANAVGAATAMHATGHRTFETFVQYALHQTGEDLDRVREALSVGPTPELDEAEES